VLGGLVDEPVSLDDGEHAPQSFVRIINDRERRGAPVGAKVLLGLISATTSHQHEYAAQPVDRMTLKHWDYGRCAIGDLDEVGRRQAWW